MTDPQKQTHDALIDKLRIARKALLSVPLELCPELSKLSPSFAP